VTTTTKTRTPTKTKTRTLSAEEWATEIDARGEQFKFLLAQVIHEALYKARNGIPFSAFGLAERFAEALKNNSTTLPPFTPTGEAERFEELFSHPLPDERAES
jgi:hypothetical protein